MARSQKRLKMLHDRRQKKEQRRRAQFVGLINKEDREEYLASLPARRKRKFRWSRLFRRCFYAALIAYLLFVVYSIAGDRIKDFIS
jgi:hypothetical protein